jgi:hypothetical protein
MTPCNLVNILKLSVVPVFSVEKYLLFVLLCKFLRTVDTYVSAELHDVTCLTTLIFIGHMQLPAQKCEQLPNYMVAHPWRQDLHIAPFAFAGQEMRTRLLPELLK